eukprot:comp24321_c1_seq1/m.45803 comp24321_c1_seq1/g.45803  ORF comp24321_c1_seq1/g.45803 comp24321_c1_seq1/m.45803 type:complete len:132 (+) comp24321_c1_seq1:362-757(+)
MIHMTPYFLLLKLAPIFLPRPPSTLAITVKIHFTLIPTPVPFPAITYPTTFPNLSFSCRHVRLPSLKNILLHGFIISFDICPDGTPHHFCWLVLANNCGSSPGTRPESLTISAFVCMSAAWCVHAMRACGH